MNSKEMKSSHTSLKPSIGKTNEEKAKAIGEIIKRALIAGVEEEQDKLRKAGIKFDEPETSEEQYQVVKSFVPTSTISHKNGSRNGTSLSTDVDHSHPVREKIAK